MNAMYSVRFTAIRANGCSFCRSHKRTAFCYHRKPHLFFVLMLLSFWRSHSLIYMMFTQKSTKLLVSFSFSKCESQNNRVRRKKNFYCLYSVRVSWTRHFKNVFIRDFLSCFFDKLNFRVVFNLFLLKLFRKFVSVIKSYKIN